MPKQRIDTGEETPIISYVVVLTRALTNPGCGVFMGRVRAALQRAVFL